MNTFTALCTNAAKQKTHPRCQQSLTLKGSDWGVWLTDLNHPAEHVQRELAHLRALVVLNSVICHDCWLARAAMGSLLRFNYRPHMRQPTRLVSSWSGCAA